MRRYPYLASMLLMGVWLSPAIVRAGSTGEGVESIPMLSDEEAWRRLPHANHGGGQPLPSWARMLAGSMPRTAAGLLRFDFVHRAHSPLDPKLRAQMRWVAAHANRCDYSEAYALADARRAGLDMEALTRGDDSKMPIATKVALDYARKITLATREITDEEFAALVSHHGEKNAAAMVMGMAYANLQDRFLLCLGAKLEAGGPTPPLDVVFAPIPRGKSSGAPEPRSSPLSEPTGKDLVDDDPEWTSVSYDELKANLARQRNRISRVRVPKLEEVDQSLFLSARPNRWNLICIGYQPEMAAAFGGFYQSLVADSQGELGFDQEFSMSLFWIVTRVMRCSYCMGYCEMGLEAAGVPKSEVSRRYTLLAGNDWSSFPASEQHAFAFAHKLTRAPSTISSTDLEGLRRDFGPERALRVIASICRNNYLTRISNGFQPQLEGEDHLRTTPPLSRTQAAPTSPSR